MIKLQIPLGTRVLKHLFEYLAKFQLLNLTFQTLKQFRILKKKLEPSWWSKLWLDKAIRLPWCSTCPPCVRHRPCHQPTPLHSLLQRSKEQNKKKQWNWMLSIKFCKLRSTFCWRAHLSSTTDEPFKDAEMNKRIQIHEPPSDTRKCYNILVE